VWGVCALATAVLAVAVIAAQTDRAPATKWPPQFPREGATKLFENEHVIVWEQVGRPKEVFQHKHIRDILNFGIDPGGGIGVLNPDRSKGSAVRSRRQSTTRRPRGDLHESRTRSTRGSHERSQPAGTIDLRGDQGTEPKDCREWSTACQ